MNAKNANHIDFGKSKECRLNFAEQQPQNKKTEASDKNNSVEVKS